MNAIRELYHTLAEAGRETWSTADLAEQSRCWWWVVTRPDQLDRPLPLETGQ